MSKKTLTLISGIVGGCVTIASAIVTFIAPPMATAIVASIGVAGTAIITICTKFVTEE